jgi:hypothetical protein
MPPLIIQNPGTKDTFCLNNTKKNNRQLFSLGNKKIFVLFKKKYINIMIEINGYDSI